MIYKTFIYTRSLWLHYPLQGFIITPNHVPNYHLRRKSYRAMRSGGKLFHFKSTTPYYWYPKQYHLRQIVLCRKTVLVSDLTYIMLRAHEKYKESDHFFDLRRILNCHCGIGMIEKFCNDTYPLLVLSLIKEDWQATKKIKIKYHR